MTNELDGKTATLLNLRNIDCLKHHRKWMKKFEVC